MLTMIIQEGKIVLMLEMFGMAVFVTRRFRAD
jgi:hypothetical protein